MPLPTKPEDFDLSKVAGLTEGAISAGLMARAGQRMLLTKMLLLVVAVQKADRVGREAYFPEETAKRQGSTDTLPVSEKSYPKRTHPLDIKQSKGVN